MGQVVYASAFAAAKTVFARHFKVLRADPTSGEIRSRPKRVQAGSERLLGASPARKVAVMSLWREGKVVMANLAIAVQRQGEAVQHHRNVAAETYSSVPNQTPAAVQAATTAEQNEDWQTQRYDHALEIQILDELHKRLNPRAEP